MATIPDDLVHWIGYLLYFLGAIILWVYCRDQSKNEQRITDIEKTRPTREDVGTMIEAALYRDTTRP